MHPSLKSAALGGQENGTPDRTWLAGSLLIATPTMSDPRFKKSVIFMCAHDAAGAMGIVINHELPDVPLSLLLTQLAVKPSENFADFPVLQGGPVETARGLLLHTDDFCKSDSIRIDNRFVVTGTIEALREMVVGEGPADKLFALGYAGWGPEQLEGELAQDAWLVVDADPELVFRTPANQKWEKALKKLGVDPAFLAASAGRA
ncbi:MAG: YqgE/AlgH family protein [Alphaproteobacteria bacterium]|nr:YqgE/AlgH family protein [Alphaproteobacteria bacterium]